MADNHVTATRKTVMDNLLININYLSKRMRAFLGEMWQFSANIRAIGA
jgi:hypothetical protein